MIEAIGVDIGGTNMRAARVSAAGKVMAAKRLPTRLGARLVLDDCLALIAALMTPDVVAIGVGLPCRVDPRRRRVSAGGYVDLEHLDPWAEIGAATGLPVSIENDATMALLGESAFGVARGMDSVVLMTIGTGIGGAILSRGDVLRGRDTAGQLGHIVVVPDGRPCVCGGHGCVETESAGKAFARHLIRHGLPADTRAETLLGRDDDAARGVLHDWAMPMRAAIDSLVVTLSPEAIVIGGGVGAAMVAALEHVPTRASGWFDAPVLAAALGDDAGVIGAAAAALRDRSLPKRAVLVNGVPASGKSSVVRALRGETGWPVLSLDTLKEPFLRALQPVDRPFNRKLGQCAYQAMFDIIADAPAGAVFILDAWFGFQPYDVLADGLAKAGIETVAEIWCTAAPAEIGRRYGERALQRGPGHPGADYVPELIALAERARPEGTRPTLHVDTERPIDALALAAWARSQIGG